MSGLITYALSEKTTSAIRSSRRDATNDLIASFVAVSRDFTDFIGDAESLVLNVRFWNVRGGRMRPISSSMLDDRSSAMTMSSPRDVISACEYGSTGSITATPRRSSAIASRANGSRRSSDASYLGDASHRTVVDATNRRRTRERRIATAASAAKTIQPNSACRKRICVVRRSPQGAPRPLG